MKREGGKGQLLGRIPERAPAMPEERGARQRRRPKTAREAEGGRATDPQKEDARTLETEEESGGRGRRGKRRARGPKRGGEEERRP